MAVENYDKNQIVDEVSKKTEIAGFVIMDMVVALASFFVALLIHNLIISPIIIIIAIVGILVFRNNRMKNPTANFYHWLYSWGIVNPPGLPKGDKINPETFE